MNKKIILGIGFGLVLAAGAFFVWKQFSSDSSTTVGTTNTNQNTDAVVNRTGITPADRAGLELSSQSCTGTAKPDLTHLPMRPEDFAYILPYGLMAGGHVTPIDHQYYSPTIFNSKPDTYDVYAMADSTIVSIGTRQHPGQGANAGTTITDYRLVFMLSCRLFYYYDLVTSLTPEILAEYEAKGNEARIPVKAGQLIGKIGGQTLDFAAWDTEHPLTGYVNPAAYNAENWKLYTADPLNYVTDEIQAAMLAKYLRTAEPRSGKIDVDVDGTIVGNWFQVNTNWYQGPGQPGTTGYWSGHFAIAPDYLDPTAWIASLGNWPDGAKQFAMDPSIDPMTINPDTGLIRIPLRSIDYRVGGRSWDRTSFVQGIRMVAQNDTQGCLLVEMSATRSLKAQAFKNQSCSTGLQFTVAAVSYER